MHGQVGFLEIAKQVGGFAVTVMICGASALAAGPAEITIPGSHVYPESITATADGTLINGSMGDGGIYRTAPGTATAQLWIKRLASPSQ